MFTNAESTSITSNTAVPNLAAPSTRAVPRLVWTKEFIDTVLRSCTNPVFLLANMRDLFLADSTQVNMRKMNVYFEVIARCRHDITPDGDFDDLTAETVAVAFDMIDREFFANAITDVFRYHGRRIIFRIVGDNELPTQGGSFSRAGFDHYVSINIDMLRRSLDEVGEKGVVIVCGQECRTKLEAFLRILEHELVHLVVYTNWITTDDPHGNEFLAVGFTFFRHIACTHALPLGPGVDPTLHNHRITDTDRTGVPTEEPISSAERPLPRQNQCQRGVNNGNNYHDNSGLSLPVTSNNQIPSEPVFPQEKHVVTTHSCYQCGNNGNDHQLDDFVNQFFLEDALPSGSAQMTEPLSSGHSPSKSSNPSALSSCPSRFYTTPSANNQATTDSLTPTAR